MHTLPRIRMVAAALLAAGLLAGCGSLSHDIARDGSSAGQLVWPEPGDTNPLHSGGTFPNLDNLRQVQAGLNKQQVMALIGPPHFNEGFVGVHEWNYVFNFRAADGQVTQCEYKVLFDKQMIARSFYWHPESCADQLNPPAAPVPAPQDRDVTLPTDALFRFDRADLGDITDSGVQRLDDLAAGLTAADAPHGHIEVIGYTDRLGSDEYNQSLSERRAATVRQYLVKKGVPAGRIDAEGRGEADPVVTCNETGRSALIACLAPNRRVVVRTRDEP